MARSVPLLQVHRGDRVESVHHGAVVVARGDDILFARGDGSWPVYYRSTSKPIQALVGVTSGAADAFGLTDVELALAAGSHSTRPEHVRAARSILRKAGLPESLLGCGGHFAFDAEERRRQRLEVETPLPVWSNCSGKHALMLASAKHLGLPLDSYLEPDHPVQVEIRRHVATLCGVALEEVGVGVDGCSAPAFCVPLGAMARSLARLADPSPLPAPLGAAARRIVQAMLAHPDMVGGPGRFDTDLMTSSAASLVAKAGAEGVHGVLDVERGLGVVVKVEDGQDRGYRLVMLSVLEHLGLLTAAEGADIAARQSPPVVRTLKGDAVGRLEVVLDPPPAL